MNQRDLVIILVLAAVVVALGSFNAYQWIQKDQLKGRLVNLQTAYTKVQQERDQSRAEVAKLTQERDQLQQANKELTTANRSLEQQNGQLQQEVGQLRGQVQSLQVATDRLRRSEAQVRAEMDAQLQSFAAGYESMIRNYNQQLAGLQPQQDPRKGFDWGTIVGALLPILGGF